MRGDMIRVVLGVPGPFIDTGAFRPQRGAAAGRRQLGGSPEENRLPEPGLLLGRAEPVAVAPGVLEAQGILGGEPGVPLLERALVGEHRHALEGADPAGGPALGADAARPLDPGPVDELLAGAAPAPEPLR